MEAAIACGIEKSIWIKRTGEGIFQVSGKLPANVKSYKSKLVYIFVFF
jgi:hypothetical protein